MCLAKSHNLRFWHKHHNGRLCSQKQPRVADVKKQCLCLLVLHVRTPSLCCRLNKRWQTAWKGEYGSKATQLGCVCSTGAQTCLASPPRAPSACSSSRALIIVSAGGGASQSNFMMLSMPMALSCNTVLASSQRCISGTLLSGRAWKSSCVHSRKHKPGLTLPARPAAKRLPYHFQEDWQGQLGRNRVGGRNWMNNK